MPPIYTILPTLMTSHFRVLFVCYIGLTKARKPALASDCLLHDNVSEI